MDKNIGKLIYDARKAAKLTQEEVAKLAVISKSYIGTIENARPHTQSGALPKPNRDKLVRMVRVINSRLPIGDRLKLDYILESFGHAPVDRDFTESVGGEDPEGFYKGLDRLSPEMQILAKKQIKAIIDSLVKEDDPDTDYID